MVHRPSCATRSPLTGCCSRILRNLPSIGRKLFSAGLILAGCATPLTATAFQQQAPAPSAIQPATAPLASLASSTSGNRIQPRFLVVLDPGHGGNDPGGKIGIGITSGQEKDVVLQLALRLRAALSEKGVEAVLTRDGDQGRTADQRAALANHMNGAACISLHATEAGNGVHLFTSSLPAAPQPAHNSFLPWQTAQAPSISRSLRLVSEINTAIANQRIPTVLGRTSLRPLDSFTCPATAVEIAPLAATAGRSSTPVTDTAYQERIVQALTEELLAWKVQWMEQP